MKLIQKYEIPKTKVVSREDELIKLCTNKTVLHLGCTDFPFTKLRGSDLLHVKLSKVTNDLYGVDASIEGIKELQEMGFSNIYCGNVERLELLNLEVKFDIIVAGEILEHLANPGLFLTSISKIMSPKTKLLITVPNAFSFKSFIHSLFLREKVHEDHNYWFSYRTISQLLQKFNFTCSDIYFYQVIGEQGLTRAIDWSLSLVTNLSPCLADGLIACVQLGPKPDEN